MTGFAQLIEWKTSRLDEVEKLNDDWRERFPTMGPSRILVCADKDNTGSYTLGLFLAMGLTVLAFGLIAYALITGPKRWLRTSAPDQEPLVNV